MKVKKSATHDIAGLTFRSASFADEAAVQEWLTAGGYEDTTITKKDDGDFYVAGVEGLHDIKSVEADGVVIMTGKREADQEVTEKTEAEKAAEAEAASAIVKIKSDEAETLLGSSILPSTVEITAEKSVQLGDVVAFAHKASGLSVADWNAQKEEDREAALAAAVEAMKAEASAPVETSEEQTSEADATVAPTLEEVVAKASKQIADLASTGIQFTSKKSGVYTVSDIGYVLNELRWMMESEYNGLSDEARDTIKTAAQAMVSVLVEAMQSTIDSYVESFKAEQEEVAKTAAEGEQTQSTKSEETNPLAELMARMDQLDAKVTELTAENATLQSAKSAAEERVKSLEEDQRQTRKSADAAEAAAANPTTTETTSKAASSDSDFVAERRKRSMLGIS